MALRFKHIQEISDDPYKTMAPRNTSPPFKSIRDASTFPQKTTAPRNIPTALISKQQRSNPGQRRSSPSIQLARHFLYRRIVISHLLLPSLYLILPPVVASLHSIVLYCTNHHPIMGILLLCLFTMFARKQISFFAPTRQAREEALKKSRWKLPLGGVVASCLLLRMWDGDEGGGSAFWSWSWRSGFKLFALGLGNSWVVFLRFVGPWKLVKCNDAPSYRNPYEISIWSSLAAYIDYFLCHLSLPPKSSLSNSFQHATLRQILFHFIVVVNVFGGLGIGMLFTYFTWDAIGFVVGCMTMWTVFLDYVSSDPYDVDISFYPNLVQDDTTANVVLQWVWKRGETALRRIVPTQLFPLFILIVSRNILFFRRYQPAVWWTTTPLALLGLTVFSAFHCVFTEILARLFLSQPISLTFIRPNDLLRCLCKDEDKVLNILLPPPEDRVYSTTRTTTGLEDDERFIHQRCIDASTSSIAKASESSFLSSIFRTILLKSMEQLCHSTQFTQSVEDGSQELLSILRYLCVYISQFGKTLTALSTSSSSPVKENKLSTNTTNAFPMLKKPCVTLSTHTHIRYALYILTYTFQHRAKHACIQALLPIYLDSLYTLHRGVQDHIQDDHRIEKQPSPFLKKSPILTPSHCILKCVEENLIRCYRTLLLHGEEVYMSAQVRKWIEETVA